jgi:hypothetical protein
MIVNQSLINHLEAFNKYAKFISDKFGIQVRFDGLKACTDGQIIYLPSLSGMNEDEIDFLYCVLLHEVGHIRYSLFTPESFAPLKSEAHFHICNALEDARIENCLMKDFDGAHDIFLNLYNNYSTNDNFMHRVFGIKNKQVSLWHAIGIYCHDYFIDLDKKKTLEEIVGAKLSKQVAKFVNEHKLDKLLEKTDLKTWDDVVELGTKIYKMYFGEVSDKSKKVDIAPMVSALGETNKSMEDLTTITKDMEDKINKLQEKTKELYQKIQEKRNETKGEVDQLNQEKTKLQQQLEALETIEYNREIAQTKGEKVAKYQTQKTELSSKKTNYEAKKQELENQLKEQQTLDGENQVSTKQEQLSQKLKTINERLNKLDEKLKNQDQKIEKQTKELNQANEFNNKLPPEVNNLSNDDLKKALENAEKKLEEITEKLNNLQSETQDEQKLRDLREEMREVKEQASRQITSQLRELQEELNDAGVPIQLIPQFEPNPVWPDGDEAQQQFDDMASQSTGEMVTNGCGFSLQSPRDIISYVEKIKDDVCDFDLGEHFYESNHESKLQSFNEETSQVTNTKETSDGKALKSMRKHLPLSTQFDKITVKNHSDNKELSQIKQSLSSTIMQVKQLFRTHLKFDKKDYFKGNQEEGRLDTRNLWKLATKTDDLYYEVNNPKFVNKVSASILVDISGSMDKEFTNHGLKLKELALILSEGLKEVHVQHEVLGYHAPVSHDLRSLGASPVYNRNSNILEHIVYKNFNDRHNSGVQNLELQCSDNSDGESLKIAGKRLLKNRSKRKVMFVILDGKPFLSDANVELLDQDLRNTIEWCKHQKIELFAFGFNEQGKEFFKDRFCHLKDYQDLIKFIKEKM